LIRIELKPDDFFLYVPGCGAASSRDYRKRSSFVTLEINPTGGLHLRGSIRYNMGDYQGAITDFNGLAPPA